LRSLTKVFFSFHDEASKTVPSLKQHFGGGEKIKLEAIKKVSRKRNKSSLERTREPSSQSNLELYEMESENTRGDLALTSPASATQVELMLHANP